MAKAPGKTTTKAKAPSRGRKVAVKDMAPKKSKKVVGGFVDIAGWDEVPVGRRVVKK